MAITAAFVLSCCLLLERSSLLRAAMWGGGLLFLIGLADDIYCLGAWSKFFFQVIAASATVLMSGVTEGVSTLSGIFWVLLLTNAHNLIDGMDGLFAGCAAIEGGMLCLMYLLLGESELAIPCMILAVICFAFRLFNRYPAQIFAGDCGSATVGFLLGMLSLPLWFDASYEVGLLSPLFLFAYPLTDLSAAVLRRFCKGRSIFSADRAHLHHRLYAHGLTQVQCGGVLLLLSFSCAFFALVLGIEALRFLSGLVCLALALLLIQIRHFVTDFA